MWCVWWFYDVDMFYIVCVYVWCDWDLIKQSDKKWPYKIYLILEYSKLVLTWTDLSSVYIILRMIFIDYIRNQEIQHLDQYLHEIYAKIMIDAWIIGILKFCHRLCSELQDRFCPSLLCRIAVSNALQIKLKSAPGLASSFTHKHLVHEWQRIH